MDAWIGVAGTVVAALLAFVFGRVNLARASDHERSESLRHQRLEVFGGFCAAMVQYRRAQLQRWFDRQGDSQAVGSATAADQVRTARADAWSSYYQLLMLTDDPAITGAARDLLETARSMKKAASAEEVEARSDEVHALIDAFARKCLPVVAEDLRRPADRWSRLRRP